MDDFLDAARRVSNGGSALDPEVLSRLIGRESEVLTLVAEGRTNVGIARRLWLTDRTVEIHVRSILIKLGLGTTGDEDHRRVLAVLAHLAHRNGL